LIVDVLPGGFEVLDEPAHLLFKSERAILLFLK
jgi:hypothetical protein